ncbi:hypothetical protein [Polaromonas sp. YR568]|uniref:hypothetical protein n=1 Tax=Polaromonas sp. YR568 TaxID=1855301 RepID=UPI003137CDC5
MASIRNKRAFITGSAAADLIQGMGGDDALLALAGDEVIDGGDVLRGSDGNDHITSDGMRHAFNYSGSDPLHAFVGEAANEKTIHLKGTQREEQIFAA